MAINLREADREQLYLLPPSVADWLPDDHLAYFVLDVVAELELDAFYATYRDDGRGGAAYDPAVTLAVLLYAYCVGERSSRRIERRLREDVAFRVVAANQQLDHATLARFRRRHADAICEVFSQVLGLCVAEGLVDAVVVSIDGTKLEANASAWANRTRRQLAEEILAEADAADHAEDEQFGTARGDELPAQWRRREDRRARVREALRQLDEGGAADYESHLAARAAKEAELGHKLRGRKPSPEGKRGRERLANPTDPDSRMLRARNRFVQGYNAQAAVSADQVIVAAEVTNAANDSTMFETMVRASEANLATVGAGAVQTFVADTGYWSVDNVTMATDAELLVTPLPATKGELDPDDPRLDEREALFERVERKELSLKDAAAQMGISAGWARQLFADRRAGRADPAVLRKQMLERLGSPEGRHRYALRKVTTEPVFGNIKANLRFRRLSGRGIALATSEWRLICAVHNLLKVRNHRLRLA
jgi:transposase